MDDKGLFSKDLEDLKCPADNLVFDGGQRCYGIPGCPLAREHSCTRRVHVYKGKSKNVAPFIILTFYFTVSDTDNDGFIDSDDVVLRRLIEVGYLNESDLKSI
jgi:hypothetical protein